MKPTLTPRELALAGLFGAAALLLPLLFHVVQLGQVFMPMYIPLVALAFVTRPGIASITAFVVPLISATLTGMPPFFPPIAPIMGIELGAMAAAISVVCLRWKNVNIWILLCVVLLGGRLLNFVLMYVAAKVLELPAGFVAGLSFVSGGPGIILMILVIPHFLKLLNTQGYFHA